MNNSLSIDEISRFLRNSTEWDLKRIEGFQTFNTKEHELEFITGTFTYNYFRKGVPNDMDWDTFRDWIYSDFNNLKYPPCHLYVARDEVMANWFIPNELLIYGLGEEEKQVVMKNMEQQLKELKQCKLEELVAVQAEREITEELYLEYCRKNQFLKTLLPTFNVASAKDEA